MRLIVLVLEILLVPTLIFSIVPLFVPALAKVMKIISQVLVFEDEDEGRGRLKQILNPCMVKVSFPIKLATSATSGGADTSYETTFI